jgi:hypothetical protein
MRVSVSHNKTQEEALRIVRETADKLLAQSAGSVKVTDIRQEWDGPRMAFSMRAAVGFLRTPIQGTVEVTPDEVIIDCRLPGLVSKFVPEQSLQSALETKVRAMLEQKA